MNLKGWIVLLALLSCSAHSELISTGVGMVKGRALTSREVQMTQLLDEALYQKNPNLKLLAIDSKAFHQAIQNVLLENAVALEAQSFNIIQVSAEELRDSSQRALKLLASSKAWLALEASKGELEIELRRKLEAKKFINFRAQSSVLPVSDGEAQRYYNENQAKFDKLPFENFKEDIKSYLSRTQVERRLKDWYDVLLNKYQVKNLLAEM
jgi:hypothetical protein